MLLKKISIFRILKKSLMKRFSAIAIFCLLFSLGNAQNLSTYEKPPVFNECESEVIDQLKSCV